jgi:predicted helicase
LSARGKAKQAGKSKHPHPNPLPEGEGTSSGFWAFAKAGKKLADLHLNYEQLEPWPLKWIETEGVPLSYHVEKMRLSKDKTQLKVNESLTLAKIPPEVFEYRLGNRSALDWVIDQYQISTDKRSGITSDPNNPDDEEYIVRLVGQVVRVSIETVKIVNSLPAEYCDMRPSPQPSPSGRGRIKSPSNG